MTADEIIVELHYKVKELEKENEELKTKFSYPKEKTINDYLQDLYKMTQSEIIEKETGNPITVEDLQDLFYQEIEQLADVLALNWRTKGVITCNSLKNYLKNIN